MYAINEKSFKILQKMFLKKKYFLILILISKILKFFHGLFLDGL